MPNILFPKFKKETAIHVPEKQNMIDLMTYVSENKLDVDKEVHSEFLNGDFWNLYKDKTCVAFAPSINFVGKYFTSYADMPYYLNTETQVIEYEDLLRPESKAKSPFVKTIFMSDVYKENIKTEPNT